MTKHDAVPADRRAVAIVTGAGRGIGEAIVRALVEDGHVVVVTDAVERRAEKVASAWGADFASLDVTDQRQWKAVVATTERRHGGVGVLVSNAGVGFGAPWLGLRVSSGTRC